MSAPDQSQNATAAFVPEDDHSECGSQFDGDRDGVSTTHPSAVTTPATTAPNSRAPSPDQPNATVQTVMFSDVSSRRAERVWEAIERERAALTERERDPSSHWDKRR